MLHSFNRPMVQGLSLAALVMAFDQLSKFYVLAHEEALRQGVEILPFLNLVFVLNRGVSFGMFAEHDAALLLSVFAIVVCGVLVWLMRNTPRATALAYGLVVGGALGNVIDRARFGAVVDFVDVHAGGWHWPAFNVADSAICIGVALLLVQGMLTPKASTKELNP